MCFVQLFNYICWEKVTQHIKKYYKKLSARQRNKVFSDLTDFQYPDCIYCICQEKKRLGIKTMTNIKSKINK